jgi:hypothetical protein
MVQLGSRARLVEAGDPSLRLKNGSVRDDARSGDNFYFL